MVQSTTWEDDDEFIVDAFEDAIDRAKRKGWNGEVVISVVYNLCVAGGLPTTENPLRDLTPSESME